MTKPNYVLPDDLEERKKYLLQKHAELKEKERLQVELPHKYGWKWYDWAWEFHTTRARFAYLCAGNQISKSSTQVRTCIEWATNPELWPELWATRPRQFWYLYPTLNVATVEFDEKWEPEFMPKGSMKTHPVTGWRVVREKNLVKAIEFNSGVTVYFKSYATNVQALQTSSAHAVFCDEELPEDLYPEISFRIAGVNGYFRMVFTATLGQEYWRRVIEEVGTDMEIQPNAFKRQVTTYDCLRYTDGTPSHWTKERIEELKQALPTQAEIDRRIYGRFVKAEGLVYQSYTSKFFPRGNIHKDVDGVVPSGWKIFAGVDVGSGGHAHPAAIVFLAVSPDYTQGRVVRCWRGDKIVTTAQDVLEKYIDLRGNWEIEGCYYDHQSADFRTVAERSGETVIKADKGDKGQGLINSLFKNLALTIPDTDEGRKLQGELRSLREDADKAKAKDDLIDALRFSVASVPWDFEKLIKNRFKQIVPAEPKSFLELQREREIAARRGEEVEGEIFDSESGRIYAGADDVALEMDEFNADLEGF